MIIYKYRLNEKIAKNRELKRRKVNGNLLTINKWFVSREQLKKYKPLISSGEIIEKIGDDKQKIEDYVYIKEEKKIKTPKKKVKSIIDKAIEEKKEIEYELPKKKQKRKYTKRIKIGEK